MSSEGAGLGISPELQNISDGDSSQLVQRIGLFLLYSVGLLFTFFLIRSIYNIWFHPLSKYPGPWYAATSDTLFDVLALTGKREHWVLQQHLKYGEVVRTGTSRLSFSGAQAWKDIYGHRVGGKKDVGKDPWFYESTRLFDTGESPMTGAIDAETHGKYRKIFTNAFSDRALREQEELLLKYVDKLISNMHKHTAEKPDEAVDAVKLYNYTTFDIMADLTFGEPLGMLENSEYSPWVAKIFGAIKFTSAASIVTRTPFRKSIAVAIMPKFARQQFDEHMDYVKERVDRRMAKETDQPDIWNLVLSKPENRNILNQNLMYEHANLFMIAGTETTATLLSGLTFYLLKNPEKFQTVVKEVRSISESELRIDKLRQLPYLQACFEEGLRMYPPVPLAMPRVSPEGGLAVAGNFVPEGTRLGVHNLSAYRNENNFKNPWTFAPERWLPEYADVYGSDRKEALQPFSTGPRNCLGKNLAYHEMRLILAKVLWNFDLELTSESSNWADQQTFALWEKHPLMIKLTKRQV